MMINNGVRVEFNGPSVTIQIPPGLVPDEVVTDIAKAIRKQLEAPLNGYSKQAIIDILDSYVTQWLNGDYIIAQKETTKLILHDGE